MALVSRLLKTCEQPADPAVKKRARATQSGPEIWHRVEQLLRERGLTQSQLEVLAGIGKSHLGVARGRWLRSKPHEIREPRVLQKLAVALDVSVDWLATGANASHIDEYPSRPPVLRAACEAGVDPAVIAAVETIRLGRGDPGAEYWWNAVIETSTQVDRLRKHIGLHAALKRRSTI